MGINSRWGGLKSCVQGVEKWELIVGGRGLKSCVQGVEKWELIVGGEASNHVFRGLKNGN